MTDLHQLSTGMRCYMKKSAKNEPRVYTFCWIKIDLSNFAQWKEINDPN